MVENCFSKLIGMKADMEVLIMFSNLPDYVSRPIFYRVEFRSAEIDLNGVV